MTKLLLGLTVLVASFLGVWLPFYLQDTASRQPSQAAFTWSRDEISGRSDPVTVSQPEPAGSFNQPLPQSPVADSHQVATDPPLPAQTTITSQPPADDPPAVADPIPEPPPTDSESPQIIEVPVARPPVAPVAPQVRLKQFSGPEFNQLFDSLSCANCRPIAGTEPPPITDSVELDQHLRQIAEDRGYRRRPEVANRSLLVTMDNNRYQLQPAAAAAYGDLKEAAAAAGHQLRLTSAFRDYSRQRQLFNQKVDSNYSDQVINQALKTFSIPGYSKHHTGYAIDLGEGSLTLQRFAESGSYQWLAADNYYNAKRFGFMPSYPPDGGRQGPDPEPWEFVYVGRYHFWPD